MEKLIAWRTSGTTLKRFREVIRPHLRKRFTERSVIAHGLWGICAKYPDALILLPTYGHNMIYKKKDFQNVSARIIEDRKNLVALMSEVYEQRKPNT